MEALSLSHGLRAPAHCSLQWRPRGDTTPPQLQPHAAKPFLRSPTLCKQSNFLGWFEVQESLRRASRASAQRVRSQAVDHAQMSRVFARPARPSGAAIQAGGQGTVAIKGSRGAREQEKRQTDAVNEERLDALSATLRGALAAAVLNGGDNMHTVAASIVALVLASVPPQQLGSFIMHLGDGTVLPSQQQIEKLLRRIDHALRSSASGRSNLLQLKEAVRLLQASSQAPSSQVTHLLKAATNTASALGTSAASSLSRSLSGASAMGSSAAEGVARGFADVARKVAEALIDSDDGLKASFAMDIDMTSTETPAEIPSVSGGFANQTGEDVFALLQSAVTAQRTEKNAKRGFKVLQEGDALAAKKEPVVYVPLELAANVTDSKPVQVQVYGQTLVLWRPRPGEVAALSDVCPHRGASLAMGSLVGTTSEGGRGKCVKCPYHGLEFDSAGTCQKKNIHTEPIKLVEANGVIWMEEKAPVTGVIDVEAMEMPPLLRSVMESLAPEPRDPPASAIPAVPRAMTRPKRSNAPAAAKDTPPATPLLQAEVPDDVMRARVEALSDARPRSDVEVLDGMAVAMGKIDGEGEGHVEDVPLLTQEEGREDPNDGMPFNEHFLEPGYVQLGGTVDIASAPRAVVDNTFDLHHMMYVHASSFGGGELIRTWKPDPLTICFEYGMNQKSNPFSKFFGDGRVMVTMQRSPPYSAMVTVGDPKGAVVLKTLTHVVPVSSTKSKLVWQLLRNFGRPSFMDFFFRQAVKQILAEDKAVLEGVNLDGVRKGMELGI